MKDSKDSKDSNIVSIIVPLYNEQENVLPFHQSLSVLLQSRETFEIIYVNDGSSDDTFLRLSLLPPGNFTVKIIDLARNFGQTAALSAGIAQSTGDILVFLDGDLQNDPQDIPRLLAKLSEGYDLVSGWRQQRQDARFSRKLPSWLANRLLARLTGLPLHDSGCTLKAYRRSVFDHLRIYGEMHRLIPAYAALNGAKITELPVRHHPRRFGTSKYGLSRTLRLLFDLLIFSFRAHFASKPMYAFGTIALFWVLLGLLQLALFPLRRRIMRPALPIPGFSPSLCCFTTGSLCLLLGLQSEQAMRTYYESQQAVPYVIRSILSSPTPLAMETITLENDISKN